jgi:hypothetical protein
MLTITTLVRYPEPPAPAGGGIRAKRARWAADGRCLQCGGERPCAKHAAAAATYRRRKK